MLAIILLAQALTVAVSGPVTSPEYLALRVAAAEGYFASEGLSVELQTTRAEPGAAEALAQGRVDLAATSLEAIVRFGIRTTSPAPRLVFGLTAAPPVALLVSTPHVGLVRSIEDLPGTRVGVSTPGAPEHAWFAWLLARAGVSIAQIGMRSLGTRGLVAAIETGEVHAGLVPDPFATRLLADGHARILVDLRSPESVGRALKTVSVNAAVFGRADRRVSDASLTAFARAVLAAERRMAVADAGVLAGRLPPAVVRDDFDERLQTARRAHLPDGLVSPEQVTETLAIMRAHLPPSPALRIPRPEELLQLEPLRRALSAASAR